VSTTTVPEKKPLVARLQEEITAGTTTPMQATPTSTRDQGGARLTYDSVGDVYSEWVGPFEEMPYYYCAQSFPRYSTTTGQVTEAIPEAVVDDQEAAMAEADELMTDEIMHPVQQVIEDTTCDRRIKIGGGESITAFEFFPGSSDLVITELPSGIYVMEIDARAWQNKQPLLVGTNLRLHVENGSIYVYDGEVIYQVILERS
jgi:hypothetical protein